MCILYTTVTTVYKVARVQVNHGKPVPLCPSWYRTVVLWPLAIQILGQVVIHLEVHNEELAPLLSTPGRWRIYGWCSGFFETCRDHLSCWGADVANVEIGIHLTQSKALGHKKGWKMVEDFSAKYVTVKAFSCCHVSLGCSRRQDGNNMQSLSVYSCGIYDSIDSTLQIKHNSIIVYTKYMSSRHNNA